MYKNRIFEQHQFLLQQYVWMTDHNNYCRVLYKPSSSNCNCVMQQQEITLNCKSEAFNSLLLQERSSSNSVCVLLTEISNKVTPLKTPPGIGTVSKVPYLLHHSNNSPTFHLLTWEWRITGFRTISSLITTPSRAGILMGHPYTHHNMVVFYVS